jgi:hypothetical protein
MKHLFSFQNILTVLMVLGLAAYIAAAVYSSVEDPKYNRRLTDARKTCILAGYDDAKPVGSAPYATDFTCVKSVPLNSLEVKP